MADPENDGIEFVERLAELEWTMEQYTNRGNVLGVVEVAKRAGKLFTERTCQIIGQVRRAQAYLDSHPPITLAERAEYEDNLAILDRGRDLTEAQRDSFNQYMVRAIRDSLGIQRLNRGGRGAA